MGSRAVRAPLLLLPLWRRPLPRLLPALYAFSTPPTRCLWRLFSLSPMRRSPGDAALHTSVAVADDSCRDRAASFFAEEGISWSSLGVSNRLSRALSELSLPRPSQVQAACIAHVLTGGDVIIAAETGSGKTYGYLIPLIDKSYEVHDHSKSEREESSNKHNISLVLCPNVMLCEQVVQMANALIDASGEPLVRAVSVCGRQGWPLVQPHILVSTPASLLNCLNAFDPERKRRTEFLQDVKCVVFDEADMLLCGSFQNQIIHLINMFRFEEKVSSNREGFLQDSQLDPVEKSSENIGGSEELVENDLNSYRNMESLNEGNPGDNFNDNEVHNNLKDWRRVRQIYRRSKQYIFIAATLPQSGKKTAGGILKRMFSDATWVSGNYLHGQNPLLEQRWIEVTSDTQVDALIAAITTSYNRGDNDNTDPSRTMVFANTVDSVESVMKILQRAGFGCISYHSENSIEDRTKNLAEFRERGGILVCTDAAARGLDIPNVSHVIQAEFASSAVDFLHRIGRTARAGQSGTVTSLYTRENHDLVSAVRKATALRQSVSGSFSRKRSFRNKLKRRVHSSSRYGSGPGLGPDSGPNILPV